MHGLFPKNIAAAAASAGLLCLVLAFPGSASAALARLEPSNQLSGIPASGAPSFVFNNTPANRFGNNVQSWFDNYAIIQNVGGANGSYNLFAHNEGSFGFFEAIGIQTEGSMGNFDLNATFDSDGTLTGGTVTIMGAIAGLGIDDPSTVLMTADLLNFNFEGNLAGFSIGNIRCAAEIQNCESDPGDIESVYVRLAGNFAGVENLNGKHYRSTIASITTVPIPAAAWLMISGLACIAGIAGQRRRSKLV
jgi:hypothetical protein